MDSDATAPSEIDRREFIRRASLAAVAGLSAPYVWSQRTEETLVVNSFGGEYQELFENAVIKPFEKKFGVKVVHDATGTSSQDYAKIRASKGAPGFDCQRGCSVCRWLATKSTSTRIPCACAAFVNAFSSSSVPRRGSTSVSLAGQYP